MRRALSSLEARSRDGSLAMLASGALLGWAVLARRKRLDRAKPLAVAGGALLGLGARQRSTRRPTDRVETGADARRTESGAKAVSDEAHAEATADLGAGRNADESQSVYQSETAPNPRGIADGADLQADDGGDVQFVEGKQPGSHREPHVEDESAHDPRLHPENDDEPTEIDLSEAAMADEASEAAGPQPQQSYPAREGTDPEPTSEEAPEWHGESDVPAEDADDAERQTEDES